ncbi:PEP-CTERM sorting domain-containing protein [Desulforhopalus sp. IMCC35007]|uniref:PEP-CTERM sorting domain-containing protein n=1 Tax=Desulforhopalus sp. IMCC35007 TaxID=2569543 RepID=UPI00145E16D8|nr:PEP-CTERM sorting domain-containing protein [Desulforhopalus sp. IMCC35007]
MKPKNLLFSFATTLAATTLMFTQLWATSLSFVPGASTIGVGESTSVDIVIEGLEFVDLSAFQFDITYNEAVLSIDSYSLGFELGINGGIWDEFIDNSKGSGSDYGPGHYDLTQLSLLWNFSNQADSFILATLNITGLGLGHSSLGFSNVYLVDADPDCPNPIDASFTNGEITVAAPVPEPSTMLLFGVGVACLAGFRRRNNSKKNALI